MGEGPFGDRVGQGAREVEGGEGVEAFHATTGAADAGDPDTVASEVLGVDLVHRFRADLFLSCAYAARGFDMGDGRPKGGAGDPEARRHLEATLVLYDAGEAGRAAGGHAEGDRLATKLERHDFVVVQRSSSLSSGTMYTFSPGFIMP